MTQQHAYDDLIGAIDQGTSSTRFLVFEKGSGQLVASSQLEVKRLTPREGWVEMEPDSIMASVHATMANVHDQLVAKLQLTDGQSPGDLPANSATGQLLRLPKQLLKCIGICNQRESAVVWDSKTGQPLYNVIVWMDNRTKDLVDDMIDSFPGRDFNHLKDKTGLPMSTYFSAFKLRWLIDNVAAVSAALREKRLLVGTVDSWILWNLTGKHLTDVTNASRTFLMDIETLQWDKDLCKQFKVPMEILPKILSSADHFGQLQFGPFMGTPVTGVIGDQSAALFGHNCLQLGQTKATFGTGCFVMQNIGPGPLNGALAGVQREAKRGLITTVGYKLKDKPACYALEGSIKIAGAALTWLRDNMQLIENYEECDQLVNTTTNSAGVFFVPALGGLYSPYWDPNASGLFIGLSQFTRREHLVRATFDAVAYQMNDILSLMHGVTNGLMIDGGLCKSDNLCQILADITGCEIVRPSMCETSALGAAMVAGCGAGIWNYDSIEPLSDTAHEYTCSSNQTHHYPHESLHLADDAKFSSLVQTKCFTKSANVQQQPEQDVAGSSQQQQQQQQQAKQDEQQQSAQPAKQIRRSLRHRNGGRLMRNLDAGGGINDDAGGGGGGDGGASDASLSRRRPFTSSTGSEGSRSCTSDEEDYDELDNASSGVHLASSSDIESTTATQVASDKGDGRETAPPSASAIDRLTLLNNLVLAPSSTSGYNSADNLEQTATGSGRSMSNGTRADSPVSSQATDALLTSMSGRESVDVDIVNANADANATTTTTTTRAPEASISRPTNKTQPLAAAIAKTTTSSKFPFSLGSYMGNVSSKASRVHENNNRKFVANAEDVADEVNEFGGRDSYGEDGYDSSTVSFDSYDDDDDVNEIGPNEDTENGCDMSKQHNENDDKETAAQDNQLVDGQADHQQHLNQYHTHHHHHHHHHHHRQRQRQASLAEKQMDVFQSYISLEHRTELVDTWRAAVSRSMHWTKVHHEEVRRIDYQRLSSLPISMYIFFSIGLVALSGLMSPGRF